MPLQTITAPFAEPIHLTEALAQIKQGSGVDDAHVQRSIRTARNSVESVTWRQLVAARYKQVLDSFPGIGYFSVPWGRIYGIPRHAIVPDRCPVLNVESIQYLDMNGNLQTLDPATYTVDTSGEPARITPLFGKIWPIPLPQIGAVSITFTAGFATPIACTASSANLTIKGPWKPQAVGDALRFSNSGGALPAPLQPDTDYFVVSNPSAGVYTVSATSGGSAITMTDAGSGTSYVGVVPEDIMGWMLMRIGSLDQFREEAIAMNRGKIEDLPFVDDLISSYSPWY